MAPSRAMPNFDPNAYGHAFAPLLAIDRRRPLDGGRPNAVARAALEKLSVKTAFTQSPVDADMAACCLAGVWLLHDFLDDSHTISQSIDTPTGSYWHGIMHRRAGEHPVFGHVGESLRDSHPRLGETRPREDWNPYDFVDLCQAVSRGKSDARELCLDVQQIEWELLFDYCYHQAAGVDRRS